MLPISAAIPEYDSLAFWKLALSHTGQRDDYGRELLVIGHGKSGPILCTRDYAEGRELISRRRDATMRGAATRRAKKAAEGARIRAIQDAALARHGTAIRGVAP